MDEEGIRGQTGFVVVLAVTVVTRISIPSDKDARREDEAEQPSTDLGVKAGPGDGARSLRTMVTKWGRCL